MNLSKQDVWKQLGLSIPVGWTLEPFDRDPDHVLITTPEPGRYMATLDFRLRGFRQGYSSTGMLFGDSWKTKRKKYAGRNWKQQLVDDAVAHLQELLR